MTDNSKPDVSTWHNYTLCPLILTFFTTFVLLKQTRTPKPVRRSLLSAAAMLVPILAVGVFELLLSGFRNFVLQKRLLVFMMLLTVGYYILFVVYVLLVKGDASFGPRVAAAFPLISLVLEYMTISGVSKAEAAIIAKASGFRLRD